MSLAEGQRRDQRRRLVVSWNRSGPAAAAAVPAEGRRIADYAAEALPERQPSVATLLPTSFGRLSLAIVGILAITAAAIGGGICEPVFSAPVFDGGGRFARTLAQLRACIDLRSAVSLAGWLGQMSLVTATIVALVVRLMRRHRRDDYCGRYRAWGWLAGLFMVAALAGQVPLGSLLGAVVSDATGIVLGPGGIGWWVIASTVTLGAVAAWAVVPLHERTGTAIWLGLGLAAWAAAAACGWIGEGRELFTVAGRGCQVLGDVLAAIAMLVAARSVIREVRGESAAAAGGVSKAKKQQSQARQSAAEPQDEESTAGRRQADRQPVVFEAAEEDGQAEEETRFTDGSDGEQDFDPRLLSKSERKRLKKLARMNRAA